MGQRPGSESELNRPDQLVAQNADEKGSSPWQIAKVASQALLFSAIQQPLDGVTQLASHATDAIGLGKISAPHIINAPAQAKFGSAEWFAETIGSGAGMVAPFMLSEGIVGKAGNALKDTRFAALADSLPMSSTLAKPVAAGALYGLVFTPSSEDNFIGDRFKNATMGGLTFGAQRAATLGIMGGLRGAGVPIGEAAFDNSLKGASTRILSNAFGGSVAGTVNANAESLWSQHRLATGEENLHSIAAFTVTGGALDLAHIGMSRVKGGAGSAPTESSDAKSAVTDAKSAVADAKSAGAAQDSAGEVKRAGGGSGAMSEVQERMTKGSEADREVRANNPAVSKAADNLQTTLAEKYGVDAKSAAGQHLDTLINAAKQREFLTLELQAPELAQTFNAIDRFLNADNLTVKLTPEQRLQLATQMLSQAAYFPEPAAGDQPTKRVLAIMQTLQQKYPGTVANALTDMLTTGEHNTPGRAPMQIDMSPEALAKLPPEYRQSLYPSPQAAVTLKAAFEPNAAANSGRLTYAQELMHTLGMNTLTQDGMTDEGRSIFAVNRVNGDQAVFTEANSGKLERGAVPTIDTPQLQHIYETLSGAEKGSYVMKNGSPFILAEPDGSYKLFADDTNYLSWSYKINGKPLEPVSGDTSKGYAGTITGTNHTESGLPEGAVKVTQDTVLVNEGLSQRVRLQNTTDAPLNLTVAQPVEHAFHDMFEVRGWNRAKLGEPLTTEMGPMEGQMRWSHRGLDGKIMSSDVHITGIVPDHMTNDQMSWNMTLAPGEAKEFTVNVKPGLEAPKPTEQPAPFDKLVEKADSDYAAWRSQQGTIESDNPKFNTLVEQAYRDLYTLRQGTPRGEAIAAGLPWFASAFGRDDLITSLQTLPFMPELSRDVLRTLANYQGTKDNPATAERPGKIMHELRVGEMARNNEIPFNPYYGTVDATPLWLSLLGRYVQQTGDVQLARDLQPNIDRALQYLDGEVARGKGYLTYGGGGKEALSNQGWKDSGDSIPYSDGNLAKAPIALSEVQGYLYDAWREAANLKRLAGDNGQAQILDAKAHELQQRFAKDFWMPDKNYVALALDGKGHQADVVASNPGQLLMTGILPADQAQAVAAHLMAPDMYSGFGIRTYAEGQARFFNNSYHDGSVWPHDNSMIALGLHGYRPADSAKLMWSLFDAAQHQPDLRLPELFGGYAREVFGVPIPYPVACKPQAWAAGAMLQMLGSNLGLNINGMANEITIDRPTLPPQLGNVTLRGVKAGQNTVDLHFTNDGSGTAVNVLNNPNNVNVIVKQPAPKS